MNEGLVFAQFGLLATLGVQVFNRWPNIRFDNFSAGLLTLGIVLTVWTLMSNRVGNFRIVPEPKEGGHLITHGPYRYIRHPMYTCLLLFAVTAVLIIDGWWAWFNWLSLLLVLVFKAVIEEGYLKKHYGSYANYMKHTKRFVPWVI
jgi:protein-S-isoprenylcysteine O-methyltransferase Ste14